MTGAVEEQVEGGCNCRSGPASCVLQGRCLTPNVVYKCTVSTQQECKESGEETGREENGTVSRRKERKETPMR